MEKTAYPERLRSRDAAAIVADSCASLWACSSPRSRCRAQPAPWLWCCRTYCLMRAARLLQNVGYKRSSCKVYFTRDGEKSVPMQLFFFLPHSNLPDQSAPLQSAAPLCRLPVCGSDLSGHGLLSAGGGRSNKETDEPTHAAR